MRKLTHYLVGVAALAIAAAAGTAGAQADGEKVGYAVGFLTDPFQAVQADLVIAEMKKSGLDPLPVANANNDAGKQISDIRNLISQGAKGIIVVAVDSDAIAPALKFADEKKVPIVFIDIGPAGGKAAMIVRANNLYMGDAACKWLGKAVGGKGTVLSLMGDQASINGRDRTTGFADCMKKEFPDIKVNEQPTYWKAEKATAAAQTVMTSTPDLAGIYMQSDSVMLPGILNLLKSSGKLKNVGEEGHIPLISIDGTPFALEKIREGLLDAAVSQPLDLYVKYGVASLKEAMGGKTFAPGPTDHGSEIVDYKGNPMDLLPSPVITKAEAGDPALWGNQVK